MGRYLDYLRLMWNTGAQQGKELKVDHKDKLKKIAKTKKKGEEE